MPEASSVGVNGYVAHGERISYLMIAFQVYELFCCWRSPVCCRFSGVGCLTSCAKVESMVVVLTQPEQIHRGRL